MYDENPRNNDAAVDYVEKSIRQFGFKVPIVIDTQNVIVCGHTRYKALLNLGIKEVACVIADDLTPDQIRAFRLVDNKSSEMAMWDTDKLEKELESIDLDLSEFDFDELEKEFEEIDDEGIKKSAVKDIWLNIDGTKVPMTEEERDMLMDKFNDYVENTGVSFGFVSELLNGSMD